MTKNHVKTEPAEKYVTGKEMDKLLRGKKRLITEALKRAVAREDYSRLEGLAILADQQMCSKPLRRQAWLMVSDQFRKEEDHFGAVRALNCARRSAPAEENIAADFYSEANALISQLGEEASREDIILLQETLLPIVNQYRLLGIIPNDGRDLIAKTERLIPILKSTVETSWTFRIAELHNAIREGMTTKEVKIELTRILAPALRKLYDEEEKKDADGEGQVAKKKRKRKSPKKKKRKPKS